MIKTINKRRCAEMIDRLFSKDQTAYSEMFGLLQEEIYMKGDWGDFTFGYDGPYDPKIIQELI